MKLQRGDPRNLKGMVYIVGNRGSYTFYDALTGKQEESVKKMSPDESLRMAQMNAFDEDVDLMVIDKEHGEVDDMIAYYDDIFHLIEERNIPINHSNLPDTPDYIKNSRKERYGEMDKDEFTTELRLLLRAIEKTANFYNELSLQFERQLSDLLCFSPHSYDNILSEWTRRYLKAGHRTRKMISLLIDDIIDERFMDAAREREKLDIVFEDDV